MVDLAVVEQDVRVDVASSRSRSAARRTLRSRPRCAPADAGARIPRCRRSCGENSGIPRPCTISRLRCKAHPPPDSANSRAAGSRSSRGTSEASSASAYSSGRSTQSALRVLLIEARSRTRRRGSSKSPTRRASTEPTRAPDQSSHNSGNRCILGSSRSDGLDVLRERGLEFLTLLARKLHLHLVASGVRVDTRMVERLREIRDALGDRLPLIARLGERDDHRGNVGGL